MPRTMVSTTNENSNENSNTSKGNQYVVQLCDRYLLFIMLVKLEVQIEIQGSRVRYIVNIRNK
jgi:hypothetical protein